MVLLTSCEYRSETLVGLHRTRQPPTKNYLPQYVNIDKGKKLCSLFLNILPKEILGVFIYKRMHVLANQQLFLTIIGK